MLNKSLLKKMAAAGMAVMMLAAFTACGDKKTDDASADPQDTQTVQPAQTEDEGQADGTTEEQKQEETQGEQGKDNSTYTYSVKLSFANYKYIDSGDASLSKMFRNVPANLEITDDSLETLMLSIIDALRVLPADQEGAETMVSDLFRINSVTLDQGTAIVDIDGTDLESASMFDEQYFIYQVTDSLLHSVSGIKNVRFLIDGDPDKEMQYMDISDSYTLQDCDEFAGQ